MTIVQALKNLVTAFGGTSTAKTASEAIEDVATAVEASSGGGGLPEVSSTDNGDILKVVEGEWAKASEKTELPSMSGVADGNVLTVDDGSAVWATPATPASPVVVLGFDDTTGAFDKTWSEILALVTAGTLVLHITSTENLSASLMIVGDVATYDDGGTNKWRVSFFDLSNPEIIINTYADSASGYPVLDD